MGDHVMKVCVLGNCQIAPLRPLLAALCDGLQQDMLPSVYTLTPQHEQEVAAAVNSADWVIGQLVTDEYPISFVRTSALREQAGDRLIVWPNAYFSGYAPEYFTLHDPDFGSYIGPFLGYHSEKIILGFFAGFTVDQTVRLLSEASALDAAWYGSAVAQSLTNMKSREALADVSISGFIEANFAQHRLFHIMNHPSIKLLKVMALQILKLIGISNVAEAPARLFMDLELMEPAYPENMFIRQQYKFSFPGSRLYRGVHVVAADGPMRVKPAGARIYSEVQMVEATFRFYEMHRERLSENAQVRGILARPRP